jgi:ATP-dependent Clp protease ATP-binding subunit ClpC
MAMNRFSEQAQDAFQRAHEAMARLGHTYLDSEHILLGLLEQKQSTAQRMLAELDADVDSLRRQTERALEAAQPKGTRPANQVTVYVTPRVRGTDARARRERAPDRARRREDHGRERRRHGRRAGEVHSRPD